MPTKAAFALVALLASALMFVSRDALALECQVGGAGKAVASPSTAAAKGWLELHRPDGEAVRVKVIQIVFVTSAAGTGAVTCARSRLQLLNGFVDVRESVAEVMRVIEMGESPEADGT